MLDDKRTIGVFGNSRGGTSAVAGIIKILGIHLYSTRLSLDDAQLRVAVDVKHIIDKRNQEYDVWGFKNPALIRSVPVLQDYLRNPRFIFVSRDPIASLCQDSLLFNVKKLDDAIDRSDRFYKAVRASKYPSIVFSYEKLLRYPNEMVTEIASFIGLPKNDEAVNFINQEKGYQYVAKRFL